MTIAEIILVIVKTFLEIWKNRTDPETARTRAAAVVTKELNDDIKSFDQALLDNDATAIAAHFEHLRDRVSKATGGSNTGQ